MLTRQRTPRPLLRARTQELSCFVARLLLSSMRWPEGLVRRYPPHLWFAHVLVCSSPIGTWCEKLKSPPEFGFSRFKMGPAPAPGRGQKGVAAGVDHRSEGSKAGRRPFDDRVAGRLF